MRPEHLVALTYAEVNHSGLKGLSSGRVLHGRPAGDKALEAAAKERKATRLETKARCVRLLAEFAPLPVRIAGEMQPPIKYLFRDIEHRAQEPQQ